MFNSRRTDLLTGTAGGAGPEDVFGESIDQVCLRIVKGDLAQLIDNFIGEAACRY